jgi:hypothetical protein
MEVSPMAERFWRLHAPEDSSDYESTFVNGEFQRTHEMPGIRCAACGQTWGDAHVMPFVCPEAMRRDPRLLDSAPIPSPEHRRLREEVLRELNREGLARDRTEADIRGAFMGGSLRVPSRPQADFLWSATGSLIVSERIRDLLMDLEPRSIAEAPVTMARIGRRDAKLPPDTRGEPEDLVRLAIQRPDRRVGSYFEIAMTAESGRPPGAEVTGKCEECGREEHDNARRLLVMRPEMWRGDPIFLLATTLWVVATDPVREALRGATNATFTALS